MIELVPVPLLDFLIDKIKHPNDMIRRFAAEVLGNAGCCTTRCVPALNDPFRAYLDTIMPQLGVST